MFPLTTAIDVGSKPRTAKQRLWAGLRLFGSWINEVAWPLGRTPLHVPFDETLTVRALLRWIAFTEAKILLLALVPGALFLAEHVGGWQLCMGEATAWVLAAGVYMAWVWLRSVPIYRAYTDEVTAGIWASRLGVITTISLACWLAFWVAWPLSSFTEASIAVVAVPTVLAYIYSAIAWYHMPTLCEVSWKVFCIFATRNVIHVAMKNYKPPKHFADPLLAA